MLNVVVVFLLVSVPLLVAVEVLVSKVVVVFFEVAVALLVAVPLEVLKVIVVALLVPVALEELLLVPYAVS